MPPCYDGLRTQDFVKPSWKRQADFVNLVVTFLKIWTLSIQPLPSFHIFIVAHHHNVSTMLVETAAKFAAITVKSWLDLSIWVPNSFVIHCVCWVVWACLNVLYWHGPLLERTLLRACVGGILPARGVVRTLLATGTVLESTAGMFLRILQFNKGGSKDTSP